LSPDPTKTYRVLFVEDAFDQALLVKAFLGSAGGFDVTHSQDGDHAVNVLASEHWDLLITDLNLPGKDGFEVIRIAREKNADLPIMATTGYTAAEFQEQAFRAGANDLLTKPLEKEDFLAHVAALLGGGATKAVSTTILAIGGLVGDVPMGCGGTLMQAAAEGKTVVVLPLSRDELDPSDSALPAAKKVSELMGLRLVIDKAALSDTRRRMAVMEKAISDLKPSIMYVPAMDDDHPARMEAFRVAQAASPSVETILGYQTATTGLDFKPTHFVEIGRQMALKMEALATFGAVGSGRMDLTPAMAQAYARYWGRYRRFMEVEAFEVIKGKI